jgi:hypothetical protein
MMQMAIHSFSIAEKGYDTVWDSEMLDFATDNFRDGLDLLEERIRERGLKFQIITEISKENIDKTESLSGAIIRHLDNLSGNFGIFDNRAYMVLLIPKKGEPPDQTLWSNSKVLVDKQQILFDKLWSIAVPLSIRKKEIEYQNELNTRRTIIVYEDIQKEIESLTLTCKKELIIFSSTKILIRILTKDKIIENFRMLLDRGVKIKMLTDDIDEYLIANITQINKTNESNQIQVGYSNKLGNLSELVKLSDEKYSLQIRFDKQDKLVASFSNEEHSILVQELMFEKHWNEMKSLELTSSN